MLANNRGSLSVLQRSGIYLSLALIVLVCSVCAVADTFSAWGDNSSGQLGNGATTNSAVPKQISNVTLVNALAAGAYHSLVLDGNGLVWAWGDNSHGQLGNGTTTNSAVPVQVSGLSSVMAVAAGEYHNLALKTDGTVWAWGDNSHGQLGNGTTTNSAVPVQVKNLSGVSAIAAGSYHSLALSSSIWAWGDNSHGQLGNGTTTNSTLPAQVKGASGDVIAAGAYHSLAWTVDSTVWAWGDNSAGQLGNGTTTDSAVPVQVQIGSISSVRAVAAGSYHNLAQMYDGTVWAWGDNSAGQLGNGTTMNSAIPVQVKNLSEGNVPPGVIAISGGAYFSLALKSDKTMWAWGDNSYGQLGNGTTTNSALPLQVSGLNPVHVIAAGGYHSLALQFPVQNGFNLVYSFTGGIDGVLSYSSLIRDSAGNFYGTTFSGGVYGNGVVFKTDIYGNFTTLYSFTGGSDGANPAAGLLRDSTGNLYGTTFSGGIYGNGVVFKLSAAGVFTTLHSFTGGADGANPAAGLILDSSGHLYGTTQYGGKYANGVVFKLTTSGAFTSLHSFSTLSGSYANADGANPIAGLIRDSSGYLYGTTQYGGKYANGAVFKLSASGAFSTLYHFTGGVDGANPSAGLLRDIAGDLYGTAAYGGAYGNGVVFKLSAAGAFSTLHSFTGGSDGANPAAGLVQDSLGNLYGTTYNGGDYGSGEVFSVSSFGLCSALYSFTGGSDGANPAASLIQDSAGNLYGTTQFGGLDGLATYGYGVVFKLTLPIIEPLYSFTGGTDGAGPGGGLIEDSAGNLYGTTQVGGAYGYGAVFKLDPAGNLTVLHNFTRGTDGAYPYAGLIQDSAGNLYGTTYGGGTSPLGHGVVFKLDPAGNFTVLHTFTGSDGFHPYAGLNQDSAGNLYGTTAIGGTYGCGVVFKLDPAGNYTVLHNFNGTDGYEPIAGLIQDSAGNLYGTTTQGGAYKDGVVFKISDSGVFSTLHSFTGGDDGAYPHGLILDSSGNLYGTTGVVFKLDTAGNLTVLHTFSDYALGIGGYAPNGLIQDSAGNLYGTTQYGGAYNNGVVFKISASDVFSTLYDFTGGGASGLFRDSAGNLYGTTGGGGDYGYGAVFALVY